MVKSKPLLTSQPADWVAAWRAAADKDGQTLSAWIGSACNAQLSQRVVKHLSERKPAHRPKATP